MAEFKKPVRIANILSDIENGSIKTSGGDAVARIFKHSMYLFRILRKWDVIVGSLNSRNCRPVQIKNRRLIIAVKNQGWSFQLQMLKTDMKNRIFKETGLKFLDIWFKIDPHFLYMEENAKIPVKKQYKAALSNEEKEFIQKTSENVPAVYQEYFKKLAENSLLKEKRLREG